MYDGTTFRPLQYSLYQVLLSSLGNLAFLPTTLRFFDISRYIRTYLAYLSSVKMFIPFTGQNTHTVQFILYLNVNFRSSMLKTTVI